MKKYLLIIALLLPLAVMAQTKKDSTGITFNTSAASTIDSATFSRLRLYGNTGGTAFNSFHTPKFYQVNWKKVKTFNDMKTLMQAFTFMVSDDSKDFKKIKKYLILTK